jgi:hypothetical protein
MATICNHEKFSVNNHFLCFRFNLFLLTLSADSKCKQASHDGSYKRGGKNMF